MTVLIGNKCILLKNGDDYRWNSGHTPIIGESIIAYPTDIGEYVALPITTPLIGSVIDPSVGVPGSIDDEDYQAGDYWLNYIVDYSIGAGGIAGSIANALGSNLSTWTTMGENGWFKAAFSAPLSVADFVTVYEKTINNYAKSFNPTEIENHTYPNPAAWWKPTGVDGYCIQFYEPNIIYIKTDSGGSGWGNICGAAISIN